MVEARHGPGQAAVDLLDEVVLLHQEPPSLAETTLGSSGTVATTRDVLRGYVHAYHAWFAEQIHQCCQLARGGTGESFLRVRWAAVPKALRARRLN